MEIESETSNLRTFVIGNPGSGKTTLINTLLGRANSPSSDKGDISVSLWKPVLYSQDNDGQINTTSNAVEIWDLPGSRLSRCLNNVYFTKNTLYLLLVASDCESPDMDVLDSWKDIALKIPEAKIIVILTKTDTKTLQIGHTVETIKANILNRIQQEQTRMFKNSFSSSGKHPVSSLMKTFSKIMKAEVDMEGDRSMMILPISCLKLQGVPELKQILTELAHESEVETKHSLTNIPSLAVYWKHILKKRKENIIFIKYSAFEMLDNDTGNTDECIAYLHDKGTIMDLTPTALPKQERYLCIDIIKFANILHNSHLDANGKTFRLEASKFWPKETDHIPPDPTILASVFENAQVNGLIPEPLFPLLWNTPYMRQDQAEIILDFMQRLGLSYQQEHLYLFPHGNFELPYFRYLSMNMRHYMASMDKLDSKTPALHWTSFLLKGDVQISVYCKHLQGLPVGVQHRIPIICRNAYRQTLHYFHIWKSGVLVRLQEVNIYVETFPDQTNITVRVNSDFFADIKSVNQVLWVTVAPCLQDLFSFLRSWPGLLLEVELGSRGDMQNNKKGRWELQYNFQDLLTKIQNGIEIPDSSAIMPFEVDPSVCNIESWVALVLSKRKEVLQQYLPEALTIKPPYYVPEKQEKTLHKKTLKKNFSVRWNLKSDEEKGAATLPTIHLDGVPLDSSDQRLDSSDTKDSGKDKSKHQKYISKGNNASSKRERLKESVTKPKTSHTTFNEELACKVATSFVTAILASGVAEFMEFQNYEQPYRWTSAQISIAKHTAALAMSTWKGNLGAVSSAIVNVTSCPGTSTPDSNTVPTESQNLSQSKVCQIL